MIENEEKEITDKEAEEKAVDMQKKLKQMEMELEEL